MEIVIVVAFAIAVVLFVLTSGITRKRPAAPAPAKRPQNARRTIPAL